MIRPFTAIVCAMMLLMSPAQRVIADNAFVARLQADLKAAESALAGPQQRIAKELEPALSKAWQELERLLPADERLKSLDRERRETMTALRAFDVRTLDSRPKLDDYDRLTTRLDALERAYELALAQRRVQVIEAARSTQEGQRRLASIAEQESRLHKAYEELDHLNRRLTTAKNRLKNYTAPPPPPGRVAGDGSMLIIAPPPDAQARAARFAARNDPASLAALSRHLFERIDLTTPGLEKARSAFDAGDHVRALDAWRDALLTRLKEPARHGLPADWGGDLDTASLLRLPVQARLDEAMQGIFSTPRAKAKVGPPGSIHWGDPGPDPAADPARNPHLDFYTMRGQLGFVDVLGPHLILLEGYAATGESKYLERWCQVIDDWAMNAPDDMEASPFNIRQYPVLCSFRPVALASTLTDVLQAQPHFAQALPAPTLARLMLTVMEEYPAAFVRLARRGIYNWRCIAMTGSVLTAQAFPEFHVARWQLDEARRLMELNWTHKILRDGGNLEQGNWGHEPNDQVHLGRAYRLLEANPPAWLDDAWRAQWLDNVRLNARYYLHTLKPDGYTYRFSRVHTDDKLLKRGRFDFPDMPIQVNLLTAEPESMRRLQWLFGELPTQPPMIRSEQLAYLGASVIRSSWEPDAAFTYFQSSPNRDCNGREDANGFSHFAYGHQLLLAPPLTVDDRTQNIHYGLVPKPGGKTIWLTCDDRGVPVDARFHTSDAFDFTEGRYAGVYQWITGPEAAMFGDYGHLKLAEKQRPLGDEPIRDVIHERQLLSIPGEDLLIVTDRINSRSPHRFDQHYTLFTPTPREGWKTRLELAKQENRPPLVIDDKARTLRTDNGPLPGLSVRHVSAATPTYKITEDSQSRIGDAQTPDEALATQGSSKLKKWTMGLPLPFHKKVRTTWEFQGSQVIITAITSRPGAIAAAPFAGDLREWMPVTEKDRTGFRAVTARGSRIECLVSQTAPTKLDLGEVSADGEALILVTTADGARKGLALGVTGFHVAGREQAVRGDFEFRLASEGPAFVPIHRPVQPVDFTPAANVFIDSVEVRLNCATPDVVIHYTLDGSEPTPDSPRYDKPLRLTDTTRLKARAYRPGVKAAPWTADSTHAGATCWATYRKQPMLDPVTPASNAAGLRWQYVEGRWAQLLSDIDRLPALKTGSTPALIDVSMRATDRAFAIRSQGHLDIPADGIYTFHAPRHWQWPDNEPGYDLRLFIHNQPWQPATSRHAHGSWSIPLKKGLHPFQLVFIDMRPRHPKPELWDNFPNPAIVWKGVVPELELEGPALSRRPLPQSWLRH